MEFHYSGLTWRNNEMVRSQSSESIIHELYYLSYYNYDAIIISKVAEGSFTHVQLKVILTPRF